MVYGSSGWLKSRIGTTAWLAMTGIYYVRESRRLFRCLNKLVKMGRQLDGEYQFTHALQMMIDQGTPFQTYYHDWVDCEEARKREDVRRDA